MVIPRAEAACAEAIKNPRLLWYLAGPYNGDAALNPEWTSQKKRDHALNNVVRAQQLAHNLTQRGYRVVVPHLCHYYSFHSVHDDAWWADMAMDLMERCDGVIYMPGHSLGTMREVERAHELCLEVMSYDEAMEAVTPDE